jgi:ATP-dependent RNA helicase DDX35
MIRALEVLYSLQVLDDHGKLTPDGNMLSGFPVEPYLARMLLSAARNYNCSEEALSIAAMLSVQNVFVSNDQKASDHTKRRFAAYEGDHLTLLNVFNAFVRHHKTAEWCNQNHINYRMLLRAQEIRDQLKSYLQRYRIPIIGANKDHAAIRKSVLSGFFVNAARLTSDGSYRSVRDEQVLHIHPTSVIYNRNAEWVVFHEVVQTNNFYMRECSVIEPDWLVEIAPHFYQIRTRSQKHQEAQARQAFMQPPGSNLINRSVF